jgi:hypothetical protein
VPVLLLTARDPVSDAPGGPVAIDTTQLEQALTTAYNQLPAVVRHAARVASVSGNCVLKWPRDKIPYEQLTMHPWQQRQGM